VLNADDPHVAAMAEYTGAEVLTYGTHGDIRIETLQLDALARARFTAVTPWGRIPVRLGVSGRHMASNAAAALAVAGSLGVDLSAAAAALASAPVSAMRMEVCEAESGAIIVNDAYNANPTSMAAALDALAAMTAQRRIAVLGVMAEIEDPVRAHRDIAAYATSLGIEVVAVGTDAYGVQPVHGLGGVGPFGPGDVVLVKASRSACLDRVAARLVAGEA
jgi:UDP-N-acetylmuramoyl-tripeptide--D-alanyl-D-alanine ligase